MHDEIEINAKCVRRFVHFLLNAPTISPKQDLADVTRECRNADIGSERECYEAFVKVVHLAREMIALEKIDASVNAARHALDQPHSARPAQRRRKASKQRDLFGGAA
jgi:hypothetical protein